MSPVATIRAADWAKDGDAIKALCWDYRALLEARTPEEVPELVTHYYAKDAYAALLEDLPVKHARPAGDILVAEINGRVLGCAMYYPLEQPGLCEIKRIFVHPDGRGHGLGRHLLADGITRARADGYTRMVLDTMVKLHEAIGLYEAVGFRPAPPFYDLPPGFAPVIRFFEYDLA